MKRGSRDLGGDEERQTDIKSFKHPFPDPNRGEIFALSTPMRECLRDMVRNMRGVCGYGGNAAHGSILVEKLGI